MPVFAIKIIVRRKKTRAYHARAFCVPQEACAPWRAFGGKEPLREEKL
jgi:hypothetical protein